MSFEIGIERYDKYDKNTTLENITVFEAYDMYSNYNKSCYKTFKEYWDSNWKIFANVQDKFVVEPNDKFVEYYKNHVYEYYGVKSFSEYIWHRAGDVARYLYDTLALGQYDFELTKQKTIELIKDINDLLKDKFKKPFVITGFYNVDEAEHCTYVSQDGFNKIEVSEIQDEECCDNTYKKIYSDTPIYFDLNEYDFVLYDLREQLFNILVNDNFDDNIYKFYISY